MTGATHKAGGMLCTIVGFEILRSKGLLLPDVNEGIQWLVMYPFCMWGSVASDIDHHWESSPCKDYPSYIINKALHITKPLKDTLEKTGQKNTTLYKIADVLCANHRSWQTHSNWTLYVLLYLLHCVMTNKFAILNGTDIALISLVLMGITLGVITHFILDMLTPEGVWIMELVVLNSILKVLNPRIKIPTKLHFVPHSKFFATGGKWEQFIQKVLKILTIIAIIFVLYRVVSPYLPYQLELNL